MRTVTSEPKLTKDLASTRARTPAARAAVAFTERGVTGTEVADFARQLRFEGCLEGGDGGSRTLRATLSTVTAVATVTALAALASLTAVALRARSWAVVAGVSGHVGVLAGQ